MLPTTEYLRVDQTQRKAELDRYHVDELSIQRSKREITAHKEGTNGSLHSDETVVTVCSICIMFDTDEQVFDRHVTIHETGIWQRQNITTGEWLVTPARVTSSFVFCQG